MTPANRPKLGPFTKTQITGFACIYLAGLGWLADIIIPFTGLPHKVATIAVILVAAELCFMSGVALLGKAYYAQIKRQLTRYLTGRGPKP